MTHPAPTPGQTIGPFFGYALPFEGGSDLVPAGTPGAVRLHGRVFDGEGNPVPDALIEIWQTDTDGVIPQVAGSRSRDGWTFTGFGRAATDSEGEYTFTTVRPGPATTGRASYFAVTVFARGLLHRLFTRAYLPLDDTATDPVLSVVPLSRRNTLIVTENGSDLLFDIHLQGERETVFLEYTASA